MQQLAEEELRNVYSVTNGREGMDNQTASRLKKTMAENFRKQLTYGIPTNEDEEGLRRLSAQLKSKKVVVKFSVKESLHAKLYLVYRKDPNNPAIGFIGSSNLTMAGLSKQGELNVDILDQDACCKLSKWFDDRWNDRWCLDISEELVDAIDNSWARKETLSPYLIYLKMAYHLSQEARAGLSEFRIPKDFRNELLEFQTAAVKIAAHHMNKRGGAIIGDVVGLGKTLMASALARIFQDDQLTETLIICPKNLVNMWQDYVDRYRLIAKVISLSSVISELPQMRRYRVVLIDESQNLRNREGKRYRTIQEYIVTNDSYCILLSATPYNKSYLDLSSQLRLFVKEDEDLGIRPERKIREIGETEFIKQHQAPERSLAAFEKSEYADDWRDLMRLFLVRRTRKFIQDNYAKTDSSGRKYLIFANGTKFYFPKRIPKTVKFIIREGDTTDPYARLYSDSVVNGVNSLALPRYGLGNYLLSMPRKPPSPTETKIIRGLSRAGKRLMGFSRTNLFKRLESGGPAFIQSVERHILRNYIFLHAIKKDLPLPIGSQGSEYLDTRMFDEDIDGMITDFADNEEEIAEMITPMNNEEDFRKRASEVYREYSSKYYERFKWISASFFTKKLHEDLESDSQTLLKILKKCGRWDSKKDAKLHALVDLLTKKYPHQKVLIFTQFADTVHYLTYELRKQGIKSVAGVTGQSENPTELAWRFSPVSNRKHDRISTEDELRILISTDVLSEGQNLQDCSIILNYDLPWAIVRLVQRAGRIDRIGQISDKIFCYSFLPAEGIEQIIRLRARVRQRLRENAEILGTDEEFFEDDKDDRPIIDIYNEKAEVLEREDDSEVDLASYAYQIWKNAIDLNQPLSKIVPDLPPVVYSTRSHIPSINSPEGVLVYMRTAEGNDSLAWIDRNGKNVTQSQLAILKTAECTPNTPALPRPPEQHALVQRGVEHIIAEEKMVGGQLGRPSSARFRTYERLKRYTGTLKGTLLESEELLKTIEDIYKYPLRQSAIDTLNRQLKSGINDEDLAKLAIALRDDNRLCIIQEEERKQDAQIICSMGLFKNQKER